MREHALPDDWRVTTIGEVAAHVPNAIVDGPFGSNLKLSDYVEEGVPVLQGKNITNDTFQWFDVRYISDRKANELKRSSVRVGDILLVKIGSIGYSAVIRDLQGFDFAIIPANLAKITPNPEAVDTEYLHKWLTSPAAKRYLESVASKTAQPALSLGKIKSLPLSLPPLAEQRRIAEALDRAEALRAKLRAPLAQLDSLTQAIFLDLFGDHTTLLEKWPTKKLGGILDFLTSGSRGWAPYYANSGDLFLRIQNVGYDELLLDDVAYVNAPDSAEAKRTRVQPGDVLLSITADLGRSAVVPEGIGVAYINQHLSILRTKALFPRFLSAYFASPVGQRQVSRRNREAVKAGLNFDDIRSFVIPLPPIELQHEFGRRVSAVEKLRSAQQASLAELDALFAVLQHRAFRGEL